MNCVVAIIIYHRNKVIQHLNLKLQQNSYLLSGFDAYDATPLNSVVSVIPKKFYLCAVEDTYTYSDITLLYVLANLFLKKCSRFAIYVTLD